MDLTVEDINESDYEFLYRMLKERTNQPNLNISHKTLPTYENHVKFLESQPYKEFWLLFWNGARIGLCYLTKSAPNYLGNEFGIYIMKTMQRQGLGTFFFKKFIEYCKQFHKGPFYVNTNPENKVMQNFIKKFEFKPLQLTFRLEEK